MLQAFKSKNFEEIISNIKISKVVFSCLLIISSIFAGICCQINQTEQNATYVKKYLANKKGYYSNLVSYTRRQIVEKYYETQSQEDDFSDHFKSNFYASLNQNPNQNQKEGVVFMQLKYLNEYFSEILEQVINQNSYEIQLNRALDFRFANQSNYGNIKNQILNNTAAQADQILSRERITIDPIILETFIAPLVDTYYNQLISVSFSKSNQNQNNPTLRFFILNTPIFLFLCFLTVGYFFYSSVIGKIIVYCFVLCLFFMSFLLQIPASNQNIDLTYNQMNFVEK